MMTVACTCDEAFGIPHSHIPPKFRLRNKESGYEFSVDKDTVLMNIPTDDLFEIVGEEPEGLQIWIDWKEVARAIMRETVTPSARPPRDTRGWDQGVHSGNSTTGGL